MPLKLIKKSRREAASLWFGHAAEAPYPISITCGLSTTCGEPMFQVRVVPSNAHFHVGLVVKWRIYAAHLLSVPGIDRNTRCSMRAKRLATSLRRLPHLQDRGWVPRAVSGRLHQFENVVDRVCCSL